MLSRDITLRLETLKKFLREELRRTIRALYTRLNYLMRYSSKRPRIREDSNMTSSYKNTSLTSKET